MKSTSLIGLLILISLLFQTIAGIGQVAHSNIELEESITKGLRFLAESQEDSTIYAKQYAGEWPVYKELSTYYLFIGKKQKERDSNCFTVSAIHNYLAELYTLDSSYDEIPSMLAKAFGQIETYKVGDQYNFWKLLPPQRPHRLFNNPDSLVLVRRPTNYKLKSRFINKTANVPEDADDTALGNTARFYQNQLFGKSNNLASSEVFDKWTDIDRSNKNWYNYFFFNQDETQAYLTWLYPEHSYRKWTFPKMALNTFFIFMPGSSAYPKAYEPWLPFGANEVDIVVNANILSYLALTKQFNSSQNAQKSLDFLERTIQKEDYWTESVYYPNDFHVFYALAKAFKAGVPFKEQSGQKLLADIIAMQEDDGSFICNKYVNHGDTIQSTVYALHALEDLVEAGVAVPIEIRSRAIDFLLKNAQKENNGLSWKGGVFFTGGTILRYVLTWKSDAYTTALVILSFKKHLRNISNMEGI